MLSRHASTTIVRLVRPHYLARNGMRGLAMCGTTTTKAQFTSGPTAADMLANNHNNNNKDQLDRLAKKLSHVEDLERHVAELEAGYYDAVVKHEASNYYYNNIGMKTAAEIEALFANSKRKTNNITNTLSELKKLIHEARDILESASKTK